ELRAACSSFCDIMSSMVLKLEITRELECKLLERARDRGQDVTQYVQRIVEHELTRPTLDEFLAPLRDEVQRSGITDDELDALVEEAREERYRELEQRTQQGRKSA